MNYILSYDEYLGSETAYAKIIGEYKKYGEIISEEITSRGHKVLLKKDGPGGVLGVSRRRWQKRLELKRDRQCRCRSDFFLLCKRLQRMLRFFILVLDKQRAAAQG